MTRQQEAEDLVEKLVARVEEVQLLVKAGETMRAIVEMRRVQLAANRLDKLLYVLFTIGEFKL